jgi:hypothetical protein
MEIGKVNLHVFKVIHVHFNADQHIVRKLWDEEVVGKAHHGFPILEIDEDLTL